MRGAHISADAKQSAECPRNGETDTRTGPRFSQRKTAAPEGSRRGGRASHIKSENEKATAQYQTANHAPIDPREIRRLRTMMLHAINQDAALTPHTRIVGVFLCGHINVEDSVRRGQAWPSAEYIADHLGIAKRTVYRAIQELEGRYFRVHRSKGRSNPNVYLPIWPPAHLDPERLGEIRQRVIEAEAEDAQSHEPDPAPRECISDTHGADGAGVEVEKGDNRAAEKVTPTAPNKEEGNKTTRTRETATDEPSVTGSRLGGGSEGASRSAIDSASLRSEFKKRFGITAYRDRFAAARIVGTTIVFPSYIWATSIDRFHLFLRQHGITDILADDRKDWSVSLVSRV